MPRPALSRCLLALAILFGAGCGTKAKVENDSPSPKPGAVASVDTKPTSQRSEKKSRSTKTPRSTPTTDDPDLMDMEQRYKALVSRIRPGMTKEQVEKILGTPDETEEKDLGEFNPQKEGQIQEIWTWHDDADSKNFIMLSFVNGRLQEGGTPGYDIRKGFKSKRP